VEADRRRECDERQGSMVRSIKPNSIRPSGENQRVSVARPAAPIAEPVAARPVRRADARRPQEDETIPELVHMGNIIFKARKARGITQLKLAEMAGMNSASIFMFETGDHNMTIKNVLRLASAMGFTLSDLVIRNTQEASLRLRETAELVEHSVARIQGQLKQLERLAADLHEESKK
jgi:transcriptional regulator with XRE-family HTH domain